MWRGVSLRKLALLLFGPMLVETLVTMLVVWMALQAAAMGIEPRFHGLIPGTAAGAYALSSLFAGRWAREHNAMRFMILSVILVASIGMLLLYVCHVTPPRFWFFLAATPVLGICLGQYYVPFQINMSHVRPFHTLAWSIAFYNIAWGSGGVWGPFISGWLEDQATTILIGIAGMVAVIHTSVALLARAAPASTVQVHQTVAFESTRAHRYVSWAGLIAASMVFRGTGFTLLPLLAKAQEWTSDQKALALVALFLPVPLCSPLWAKMRYHLQSPWLMFVAVGIGAAAFVVFGFTNDYSVRLASLVVLGVMDSAIVFTGIYYANADAVTRGKSVSIYEALVGSTTVAGPIFLGLVAWTDVTAARTYLAGAALLVVCIPVMMLLWGRRSRGAPVTL